MTPIRPANSFNRQGYIATLRSTKITEDNGLSILIFLAEKCDEYRMAKRRHFTAKVIGRHVGIPSRTALRRIRRLIATKALSLAYTNRVSHFQLPTETELQKFA